MSIFNTLSADKRHLRRVQLGSGGHVNHDLVNIDITPGPGVDIVHDLRKGLPFDTNEIQDIYSHHVLEHFNYYEIRTLMQDCLRCLRGGGLMRAVVPDFRETAKLWLAGTGNVDYQNMLMTTMLGGQAVGWAPKASQTHSWGYCPDTLAKLFSDCGFTVDTVSTDLGSSECGPSIYIIGRKG